MLNVKMNEEDLNLFIHVFTEGVVSNIDSQKIVGPYFVPGNDHIPSDVEIYIGKINIYLD